MREPSVLRRNRRLWLQPGPWEKGVRRASGDLRPPSKGGPPLCGGSSFTTVENHCDFVASCARGRCVCFGRRLGTDPAGVANLSSLLPAARSPHPVVWLLRRVGLQPAALRHTFASFSIAAGVSLFELARFMGTSVDQIDKTYGHLLPDSLDRARGALDTFLSRREDGVHDGRDSERLVQEP